MQFRQDINAIRAYAVLSVVLFHFLPNVLPGGFAGVDIFFVVSGFLMTSIITNQVSSGKFNVISFYHARVKRIVPALSVLCVSLLVYGWFFLLPTDYQALAKHVGSSQAFLSNFVYLRESGYFTADAHEKWLLHTWSLSVEWQFYVIYPLVLLAIGKIFSRQNVAIFVLISLLISFGFSVYWSFKSPESSYFMIYTRAWEMLAGAVVFFIRSPERYVFKKASSYCGFALILIGLVVSDESHPWPGYMALAPVVGTCLILWANTDSFYTKGRVISYLGSSSYSIYLWHWPIVVFISYMGFLSNIFVLFLGMSLSIFFGSLSYIFVEKKFTNFLFKKSEYFIYLICMAVLVVSIFIYLNQGVTSSFRPISTSDKAKFIQNYREMHVGLQDSYWLKCNAYKSLIEKGTTDIDSSCTAKSSNFEGVFLWGDSHAEAFSFGLRTLLGNNHAFYQVTSAGCNPSFDEPLGLSGDIYAACLESNRNALKWIKELRPKVLILSQRENHEFVDWNLFYERLSKYGVTRVIVIGPLPQWQPSLPSVIAKRHWNTNESSIVDPSLNRQVIRTNKVLLEKAFVHNVEIANVFDELCKIEDVHYRCLVRLGSEQRLIAVDYAHLSKEGSMYLTERIVYPMVLRALQK